MPQVVGDQGVQTGLQKSERLPEKLGDGPHPLISERYELGARELKEQDRKNRGHKKAYQSRPCTNPQCAGSFRLRAHFAELCLCDGRLAYFLPGLAAFGFCKLFIISHPDPIIRRLVSVFQLIRIFSLGRCLSKSHLYSGRKNKRKLQKQFSGAGTLSGGNIKPWPPRILTSSGCSTAESPTRAGGAQRSARPTVVV